MRLVIVLGLAVAISGCGRSEAHGRRPPRRQNAGEARDGGAAHAADADGGTSHAEHADGGAPEGQRADGGDAHAEPAGGHAPGEGPSPAVATMQAAAMLGEALRHNALFVHDHGPGYFADFRDAQHPRATLLACADSRFHVGVLDGTADGDVFEIRNIGNQIEATPGSVEYGVRHLHTPLLLIVGHVGCGAVKAAMGDGAGLEPSIRTEIIRVRAAIGDAPHAAGEDAWVAAVQRNVRRQVAIAVERFASEIEAGTLWVVGAVYDFRDDLERGQGRVVVIDVNGSDAPAETPLLQLVLSSEPVDEAVVRLRPPSHR